MLGVLPRPVGGLEHDVVMGSRMTRRSITVVGAGIVGLWQALLLARAGHDVHVIEQADAGAPTLQAASRYAGAMLAPDCEAEAAPPLVRDLGRAAIALWRDVYPALAVNGSLVVAANRDANELKRYARATQGHMLLERAALTTLEPDLAERFDQALYFAQEAHMSAPDALAFLLATVQASGARVSFGTRYDPTAATHATVIDCRGYGARDQLPKLRGVRGERVIVQTRDVNLQRAVRLLHPRVPLYVVPWPDHHFMIGATVIESDDDGPMTLRSALELLGAAYTIHPAFAEASIIELGAGVRPAWPDNIPRIHVEKNGHTIHVNGAYRHGFLLAPILATAVTNYLSNGQRDHPLLAIG
jgi:glycine oxidase